MSANCDNNRKNTTVAVLTSRFNNLSTWFCLCTLPLALCCKQPAEIRTNVNELPNGSQRLVDTYNPPIPGATEVILEGNHLYSANEVELLLRNRKGKQYQIKPVSYGVDGHTIKINLPADIEPSQYSIQWLQKGKLVAAYNRFLIQTPLRTQPQLIAIRNVDLTGDPAKPLRLDRDKPYQFNYVITQRSKTVRVVLQSINDATKAFQLAVDQKEVDNYNSLGPDFGKPSFTIPDSVPPGRYNLILHYLNDDQVVEGEPMEREIEITENTR